MLPLDLLHVVLDLIDVLPDLLDLLEDLVHLAPVHVDAHVAPADVIVVALGLEEITMKRISQWRKNTIGKFAAKEKFR